LILWYSVSPDQSCTEYVPREVSFIILQYVDKVSDLRNVRLVCKTWADIALQDDIIIKRAYHEQYPFEICLFSDTERINWREVLFHRRKMSKFIKFDQFSISTNKISENFIFGTIDGRFLSYFTKIALYSGKWYYEAIVEKEGLAQLGFCTLLCTPYRLNGVGDDIYSYSYDGSRQVLFHESGSKYGIKWKDGDIVGICLDLSEATISYYQNGEYLGIAFKDIIEDKMDSKIPFFPALSLQYHHTKIHYVFDKKKMKFSPPSGFKAIGEGLEEKEVETVRFFGKK